MTAVKAAIVREKGGSFGIEEVHLDDPGPAEVRVRLVATGICHTDLLARDGLMPPAAPAVYGHEGSGVVTETGAAVRSVAVGDHVILSPAHCGDCVNCLAGHPMHCRSFLGVNLRGRRADGTSAFRDQLGVPLAGHFFGQSSFSHHAVVHERSAVKVRTDVPLELLGPLGCGLQTGAGAVFNALRPPPGSSIAVFGAGAVGLAAVMAARVAGCGEIIAVDLHQARLELAAELGATRTLISGDETVAAITATTGGGVDFALDAVGLPETVRSTVDVLNVGGTAGIIGSAGTGREVSLDISRLFTRTVKGIVEGDGVPKILIPQLVDLFVAGRFPIDRLVTRFPFARVNDAAAEFAAGRVVKPILIY